jgi:hypothetical protein
MMSIGMHCRLLGRPGRFRALQRFLDYVQQHERVWVCTRQQIADHWRECIRFRNNCAMFCRVAAAPCHRRPARSRYAIKLTCAATIRHP